MNRLIAFLAVVVVATVTGFAPSSTGSGSRDVLGLPHPRRTFLTTPGKTPLESISSSVSKHSTWLAMASEEGTTERSKKSTTGTSLPFWLDIGTKGGAIVWSLVLFIVPIIGYNVVTGIFGVDEIEAGKWIGVGFTAVALLAWGSTYLFRVATKDMTYAKQLKDYENAVIAKRLEELDDDEIQALVEEIERDEF